MKEQKDMSPFARAMRVKLGLVQPQSEPEVDKLESSTTGKTFAQEWFEEMNPDLSEEAAKRLIQES